MLANFTGYMNWKDLYRPLSVLAKARTADAHGGWSDAWTGSGVTFQGIVDDADTRVLMLAQQLGYSVSHVVYHDGQPLARAGDRLVLGNVASGASVPSGTTLYAIHDVSDPGLLGYMSTYHVEELRP